MKVLYNGSSLIVSLCNYLKCLNNLTLTEILIYI